MRKIINKLTPEWSLRLGLGSMYIYSGIDMIRHPTAWHWAVKPLLKWSPASIQATLNQPEIMNRYLLLQGIVELALAFILFAWFLPKFWARWAALITILEFVAILLLIPIDAITFRDIGLLGGALALWIILSRDIFVISTTHIGRASSEGRAEKHEPDRGKKAEHSLNDKAGEPTVETFEEFMGQHK